MSRGTASCPDWAALVAARDGGSSPAGFAGAEAGGAILTEVAWREALAHLATCGACRPAALGADPTLLFQSLPRIELAADDVAAMRQRVAAMRRAQRVTAERRLGHLARVAAGVSRVGRRGRGLAAAVLLAAVSGGLWLGLPASTPAGTAPTTATEAVPTMPFREPAGRPGAILPSAAEPVFMDLSSPRAADVYRVGRGGGLQVVMVVDETLDV
ncbi:MAG TPA: hypothetical protein VM617_02655 [Thermoanaerobaculia bacterium]|nr:hypothetical protein [Thermoanaerobaculia bacterium]